VLLSSALCAGGAVALLRRRLQQDAGLRSSVHVDLPSRSCIAAFNLTCGSALVNGRRCQLGPVVRSRTSPAHSSVSSMCCASAVLSNGTAVTSAVPLVRRRCPERSNGSSRITSFELAAWHFLPAA
jgi:hypothetical protein